MKVQSGFKISFKLLISPLACFFAWIPVSVWALIVKFFMDICSLELLVSRTIQSIYIFLGHTPFFSQKKMRTDGIFFVCSGEHALS